METLHPHDRQSCAGSAMTSIARPQIFSLHLLVDRELAETVGKPGHRSKKVGIAGSERRVTPVEGVTRGEPPI
jgi:hypothetical protein